MNLIPSPSYFPIEPINEKDHDQAFVPNHQLLSSSSSSSASYHIFFNSTQDHAGYHRRQLCRPHYQEDDHNHGGSSYEMKNNVNNGLKLTLWKKEDEGEGPITQKDINPVKYMELMKKTKKTDRMAPKTAKVLPSSSLESTDISSNSSSYSPIRVCADCNTTKTPLWRSGPKGPKSLCNACGIRQRKARRAMAAAAAGGGTAAVGFNQPPAGKMTVGQYKDKTGKIRHSSQLKKSCKMTVAGSSSSSRGQKKLSFEDFLIKLSNSLAFHRVFPQDEKDAAILLMALSSGLLHG